MFYAAKGDTVTVHYTGTLSDGTIFDTSRDKAPLKFIIGKQEVIPGFEEAVIGMVRGESKKLTFPPEKGYGLSKQEYIEEIAKSTLPPNLNLTIGRQLEVTRQNGTKFYVMVTDLTDTTVTLDANHPLAGKDLTFEIEMIEIEKEQPKQ